MSNIREPSMSKIYIATMDNTLPGLMFSNIFIDRSIRGFSCFVAVEYSSLLPGCAFSLPPLPQNKYVAERSHDLGWFGVAYRSGGINAH